MKKLLFVVCIIGLVFSCQSNSNQPTLPPDTYQINITAKGIYNGIRGHIGVLDQRRRPVFTDTAMVVNETMTFTGTVNNPVLRLLTINGVQGNLQFVLEPGITNIELYKDSIHTSKIEGTSNNKVYAQYKAEFKQRQDAIRNLQIESREAFENQDTTLYQELYQQFGEKSQSLRTYPHEFIAEHPDQDFSLLLLETTLAGRDHDLEKLKASLTLLEDVINRNPGNQITGQNIKSFVAQQEAVANVNIGKVAPDFSAPTPDGEMLALKDIKGKATIVEFWASWCGPCRRENPNIVNVYNKYHDKGLEIIGISLDRPDQKQRWLDAIEKDNLSWHHVSNLKYFNDPVARLYNVSAIPASFILDENGTIVAKKLRGKALEDQIASMLN